MASSSQLWFVPLTVRERAAGIAATNAAAASVNRGSGSSPHSTAAVVGEDQFAQPARLVVALDGFR